MHISIRNLVWVLTALTKIWIALVLSVSVERLNTFKYYGHFDVMVGDSAQHINITVGGTPPDTTNETDKSAVLQFRACPPTSFAGSDIPVEHDTILTVNGETASRSAWRAEVGVKGHRPVGYKIPVTYRHDGEVKSTFLVSTPIDSSGYALLWGFLALSTVAALLYVGIAAYALFRQGDSGQARILALLNLALSMFVIKAVPGLLSNFLGMSFLDVPWRDAMVTYIGLIGLFGTGFWLHLALVFPFPSRILQRRPILSYILMYAPPLLSVLVVVLAGEEPTGVLNWVDGAAGLAKFAQVIAAAIILFRKRKRAPDQLARRQLKAVFWGLALGPVIVMVPIVVAIVVLSVIHDVPFSETMIIGFFLFFVCMAFLPIPISFLYAFRKYRLMEVELRFRRGTRFAVVTGGLLIVFFGVLYVITSVLLRTLALNTGTAALTAGFVLALGFAPVHRRTQQLIERRFYPERNRLRSMLNDLLAASASMPDRAALWGTLHDGLEKGLGLSDVIPVLRDERLAKFTTLKSVVVPVELDSPLASILLRSGRPLFLDECCEAERVTLTPEESNWFREHQVAVLLPMIVHSELTGFLALAFAPDHEDLAAEDLNVLVSVVSQVALQSENLRLLEENVEKRRLQEQLEMAREVQQRFLPQVLPETPRLDVATRFRSSLEVAGDYYDVVPLSGGRTLIAVGDVAGKGAGAAMIMANLQASLRTMAHADVSLARMVSGANDLLCANTTPSQFVTFFAAIFDPQASSLLYVNAGHNPPRVVRADGSIELLEAGGMVLGVFAGAPYQEATVTLASGDVIVAFTDGVSEAMNEAEEEFSEERIADIAKSQRTECAESVAAAVEENVTTFRGPVPLGDDFTLLVAKVK